MVYVGFPLDRVSTVVTCLRIMATVCVGCSTIPKLTTSFVLP